MRKRNYKRSYKPLKKRTVSELKNEVELIRKKLIKLKNEYEVQKINFKKIEFRYNNDLEKLQGERSKLFENPDNYNDLWLLGKSMKKDAKAGNLRLINKIRELEKSILIEIESALFGENSNSMMDSGFELDHMFELLENSVDSYKTQINKQEAKLKACLNLIESKSKSKKRDDAKKAIIAKAKQEIRKHTSSVKAKIKENNSCPYCGNEVSEGQIDHIYPVIKGGLSILSNMVHICAKCNRNKSDYTLNQFIQKFGLNREFVENNLRELGKDF